MNVRFFFRRNAKRITARLNSNGEICITAPYGFDPEANQHIIQTLIERITAAKAAAPKPPQRFHDGCVLKLDWATFHINHSDKETAISATYSRKEGHTTGHITVARTLKFDNPGIEKRISNLLIRIAEQTGIDTLLNRAKQESNRLGIDPSTWKIGRGRRTLGTCRPDRSITLSVLLLFLPLDLQRFVICHELAHLSEMNHSERFHKLCNNYLGGREAELNKLLKNYPWPIRR